MAASKNTQRVAGPLTAMAMIVKPQCDEAAILASPVRCVVSGQRRLDYHSRFIAEGSRVRKVSPDGLITGMVGAGANGSSDSLTIRKAKRRPSIAKRITNLGHGKSCHDPNRPVICDSAGIGSRGPGWTLQPMLPNLATRAAAWSI
jgi:hypothetical protein